MASPDPTPKHAPRIAIDTMRLCIPHMQDVAQKIAGRYRKRLGEEVTLRQEDLEHDTEFNAFLQDYAQGAVVYGGLTKQNAAYQAALLAAHLHYYVNFELHRRKVFWVAPSLAYQLGRTNLDIDGEVLKPPFPSCAFVFTDSDSLALAEALVQTDEPDWLHRPGALKVITAHVTESEVVHSDAVGFNVDLLLDQYAEPEWPILYSRNLLVRDRDRLDVILDSHFPDIDPEGRDPVFTSPELKQLLHLVINAVLYATSTDVEPVRIRSPLDRLQQEVARKVGSKKSAKKKRKAERQVARFMNRATGEDVFYLPGKIPIGKVEQLSKVEKSGGGRTLMTRFMVRGHWRKANPTWKDQRPRWIAPYWKGPELATVIEKQYEMK